MKPALLTAIATLTLACASGDGMPSPTKDPPPIGDATTSAGGSEQPDAYHSGQRLEMRTAIGDDESRLPGPIWDSALGRHCELALIKGPEDVDGAWRCAPMRVAASCLFTDYQCSKPALFVRGGAKPGYVRMKGCHVDDVTTVHAVGSQASQLYQEHGPGDCTQLSVPGNAQVYALGDDMAGTLVELEVE